MYVLAPYAAGTQRITVTVLSGTLTALSPSRGTQSTMHVAISVQCIRVTVAITASIAPSVSVLENFVPLGVSFISSALPERYQCRAE